MEFDDLFKNAPPHIQKRLDLLNKKEKEMINSEMKLIEEIKQTYGEQFFTASCDISFKVIEFIDQEIAKISGSPTEFMASVATTLTKGKNESNRYSSLKLLEFVEFKQSNLVLLVFSAMSTLIETFLVQQKTNPRLEKIFENIGINTKTREDNNAL